MADQLALLPAGAGAKPLWFRACDLLGRPVADLPVHECPGGWGEAEKWCYLATYEINASIRLAWRIEEAASPAGDHPARTSGRAPCCAEGSFDRHYLAHVAAHLEPVQRAA